MKRRDKDKTLNKNNKSFFKEISLFWNQQINHQSDSNDCTCFTCDTQPCDEIDK